MDNNNTKDNLTENGTATCYQKKKKRNTSYKKERKLKTNFKLQSKHQTEQRKTWRHIQIANSMQSPLRQHQEQSPKGMNKRCNAQGSTKSLQRSYNVEIMDSDTDHIVASLDLEGITNNYNA